MAPLWAFNIISIAYYRRSFGEKSYTFGIKGLAPYFLWDIQNSTGSNGLKDPGLLSR